MSSEIIVLSPWASPNESLFYSSRVQFEGRVFTLIVRHSSFRGWVPSIWEDLDGWPIGLVWSDDGEPTAQQAKAKAAGQMVKIGLKELSR